VDYFAPSHHGCSDGAKHGFDTCTTVRAKIKAAPSVLVISDGAHKPAVILHHF